MRWHEQSWTHVQDRVLSIRKCLLWPLYLLLRLVATRKDTCLTNPPECSQFPARAPSAKRQKNFGGLLPPASLSSMRQPKDALHWTTLVEAPAGEVTELLRAWSAGDRSVEARLFEIVLPDLRKLAQCFLRRENPNQSMQATVLLNEAYLRLVGARAREWQGRKHFFAITARVMRRLLIDRARGRKRAEFVDMEGIEEMLKGRDQQLEQAIAIDSLLDTLEAEQPDLCHIVELRFFLGLTEEEAADALGLPVRTAQRRYSDARKWLFERLASR